MLHGLHHLPTLRNTPNMYTSRKTPTTSILRSYGGYFTDVVHDAFDLQSLSPGRKTARATWASMVKVNQDWKRRQVQGPTVRPGVRPEPSVDRDETCALAEHVESLPRLLPLTARVVVIREIGVAPGKEHQVARQPKALPIRCH